MRAPARLARKVISIWKTYPPAWTPSNGSAASVVGPPCLEAAGEVVRAEAQHRAREQRATARDEAPAETPVDDPAAARVAGTDDQVGRALDDRGDECGQEGRIVAEVGVHLDDDLGAALERDREPVEVGAAEALLGSPMADQDPLVGRGQLIGDPTGPIGRRVVDHEQRRPGQGRQDRLRHGPDVVGLVVGRQDDPCPRCGGALAGHGRQCSGRSRPQWTSTTTVWADQVEPTQLRAQTTARYRPGAT